MDLAGKSRARRVVVAQLVTAHIAALVLVSLGGLHAWSGLIGGLIAVAGNGLFMLRAFVPYRAQEPGRLLGRFYGAELQKLILTAALFAMVFLTVDPLSPGALFGVFVLVQMAPILIAHTL